MEKALIHPTADELDDWNDYQKVKTERRQSEAASLLFGGTQLDQVKSADSGYSSRSRQASKPN